MNKGLLNGKPVSKVTLKQIGRNIIGLLITLFVMLSILYVVSLILPKKQQSIAQKGTDVTFRDGDIIFQEISGELGGEISAITGSPINHCGLIFFKEGELLVLEAADQVKLTPLKEWIFNGVDKKIALLRYKMANDNLISTVLIEAEKFRGNPYDYQYSMDDENIYCSELVYKAYKNGAGVKLCPLKKLRDLDYKGHEEFIKKLTNGKLPLDREIITPVDIYKSEKLYVIYNDF
ncbi:MAG: hypothetical protein K8T10_04150 [Candidatus Eremiobacteraeota bacterium]|nr:hypothetical protein [Candidatus Eremiobacteraeota bacterium]